MRLGAPNLPENLAKLTGGEQVATTFSLGGEGEHVTTTFPLGGEGEPVAITVPSLHPVLILSPEAHWRSDVTPNRKLPTVPVSPCWMTSES